MQTIQRKDRCSWERTNLLFPYIVCSVPESAARPCGPHDLLLSAGNLARQWAKHVRPSVLTHQPLMPAAGDYQSRKFGGDSAEPQPHMTCATPHCRPEQPRSGSFSEAAEAPPAPGTGHVALRVESTEVAGFSSQKYSCS